MKKPAFLGISAYFSFQEEKKGKRKGWGNRIGLPSLDISDPFSLEGRSCELVGCRQTLAGFFYYGVDERFVFEDCGPDGDGRAGCGV